MGPDLAVSVRAVIEAGAQCLRDAGIDGPRREALRLWAATVGGGPGAGVLDAEVEAGPHADSYAAAIRRRATGEPLGHVTGRIGFRRLELIADRRALIPRPETEGLVELMLRVQPVGRVADIGTGSGCIALSLAAEGSYDSVVGVDSSAEALAQARLNRTHGSGRVGLVSGDLCTAMDASSVDALVSNPPYLTAAEYAALDSSVRDWEPALALVGGADGLESITRLLEDARRVVRPGGWLALEIDCSRAAECAVRAGAFGWVDVAIHADLFGRERYLLARRKDLP